MKNKTVKEYCPLCTLPKTTLIRHVSCAAIILDSKANELGVKDISLNV